MSLRVRLFLSCFLLAALVFFGLLLLYPLGVAAAQGDFPLVLVICGAVLVAATALLSHLLARDLTKPLLGLHEKVRNVANTIGMDLPEPKSGDEVREIARYFIDVAQRAQQELHYRKLALDELEAYKAQLMRSNSRLAVRLFQSKVMLSLWDQHDKAKDTREFLSLFLEQLLPGLPFEYGCVIIRPLAVLGPDMIFAKALRRHFAKEGTVLDEDELGTGRTNTEWLSELSQPLKDFLLVESSACMTSGQTRRGNTEGALGRSSKPTLVQVMSVPLKQGNDPLGSMHFLTESASLKIGEIVVESIQNLSQQVAALLQLRALSSAMRVDPVTKLYNQGYLNDRLREELVRSSRSKQSFSLVLLEIDNFQAVATAQGQKTAEEGLIGLASQLRNISRGSDAVCRLDGNRMAVLLADTAAAGAKIFAENIRRTVENTDFTSGHGAVKFTVSLGIAEHPLHGASGEALQEKALGALVQAQEAGGNRWQLSGF